MGFRPPHARLLSPVSPPVDNGDGTVSDEWFVRRVRGREGVSQLYELEITFQTSDDVAAPYDDATLEEYLDVNWLVQVVREVHGEPHDDGGELVGAVMHAYHGVFRELEMLPINVAEQSLTHVGYRAVLVPRLWYATQTTRTRIFQGMSVPEIIEYVLKESGLDADVDFELRLRDPHPMREYTLQYAESDYNFIARLAEHEGIFFFFEQTETCEKVVWADHNDAFQAFASHEAFGMPHVRHEPTLRLDHQVIRSLRRVLKKVPRVVTALDYDHAAPRANPQAAAEVSRDGIGIRQYYLEGKEYTLTDRAPAERVADQMTRLARVRAQELRAGRDRLVAESTVVGLGPGMTFTLENHFDENLVWANAQKAIRNVWLVVESTFDVDQESLALRSDEGRGPHDFVAHLVVQSCAVPFRAPRVTPRPVVAGVLNARVHDLVKGAAADLDPRGQYVLMFDLPTIGAPEFQGATMRRFRMAQTFSGPGYGMHHPLHLGAEVLVAHLAGDPDRPIIIGSPPNADNATPITGENPTHGGFKTRGGVVVFTNDEA